MRKSLTKCAALSSPDDCNKAPTMALNVLAKMRLSTGYSWKEQSGEIIISSTSTNKYIFDYTYNFMSMGKRCKSEVRIFK